MLRLSLRQWTSWRSCYLSANRQNENIKEDLVSQKHATIQNDVIVPRFDCISESLNSVDINKASLDPKTPQPFDELHSQDPETMPFNSAEFLDDIGPPLPISFNLAAFVNCSESLVKLVHLGVDLSEIEQTPEKANFILKLDFEKHMKDHIQFLHDHGVPSDYLGKFVTKNPLIFKETLKHLEIRINYLKSKKFSESAISRILTSNPFFLSMETKQIDSRLGFFQKQFSLTGDEVRSLLAKCPKLIIYKYQKFLEKLFVVKEELGFSRREMKKLLLGKPKVWMLGTKQLKERFDVVHNIMGLPHERIIQNPCVFLKRGFILKQRHQYLVHLGRAQYDPAQPMFISLTDLATTTDAEFCKRCTNRSMNHYNEFLKTL